MRSFRSPLAAAASVALSATAASASHVFHDWTPTFTNTAWLYSNTSSAGTITGSSNHPGFGGQVGTWGIPLAITTQSPFTSEFQIHGTSGLGNSVTFNFSNGYAWGSGGELIIGNIHNYYEYTLSAWDFSNNPINVNAWTTINEYQSTAPGTIGYFSTSTTNRTAAGNSSKFWVFDSNVNANMGQGGVVHVGGLVNVAKIELKLTSSSLAPNGQQVDFILFNVATPVPAPAGAMALGLIGLFAARRRR